MFSFVVICMLLDVFIGVYGEDPCFILIGYDACSHHFPREKLNAIEGVPNEEELLSICPGELEYFKCFLDEMKDCKRDEESFSTSYVHEIQYGIVKDLCNENTSLHRNYVASAECYKTLKNEGENCNDAAELIYREYKEYLEREHPERLEDFTERSRRRMCMVESYQMACLAEKVQKTCGDIAHSTMLEIVDRSKYLRQFCTDAFVDELKTTFLERLSLEEDDRESYANSFSFIKK